MRAGLCLDQVAGDAHPVAALAHAAFEHIADAEFAADLLHIDRLALVGEARIAGDDEEPADARQRGDDLLDHAVGEIFLLRVAAHVLERQDRDRRLVGERRAPVRRSARRGRDGDRGDPIGPHGLAMFLTCCSPRSSKARSSLSRTCRAPQRETQIPPGSARASSRAAMLTPSPKMSPSSMMMSPTIDADAELDPAFGRDTRRCARPSPVAPRPRSAPRRRRWRIRRGAHRRWF